MNQNEEQVHLAKTNSNGGEKGFFQLFFYWRIIPFCVFILLFASCIAVIDFYLFVFGDPPYITCIIPCLCIFVGIGNFVLASIILLVLVIIYYLLLFDF